MASRAVVIGSARYAPDAELDSHLEIRHSAFQYGQVLSHAPGWNAPGQVEVIPAYKPGTGGDGRIVSDDPPLTADDVITAVRRAAAAAGEGDILLVIYVGHGKLERERSEDHVHFAVETSRGPDPHSWLASRYVYQEIRKSAATLKVLIADCCNSRHLRNLSGMAEEHEPLPMALGREYRGTCVMGPATNKDLIPPDGCHRLQYEDLRECTPFSGHLLEILRNGTKDDSDKLTLGMIRNALERNMNSCGIHDEPLFIPTAKEETPFFINRTDSDKREKPVIPDSAAGWAKLIGEGGSFDFSSFLERPSVAGDAIALLFETPGKRDIALRNHDRATAELLGKPDRLARYLARAGEALSA